MRQISLVVALLLIPITSSLRAGVINGIALEDKGICVPTIPVKVFTSSMYIKLVSGWGTHDGEEYFRLNGEKIFKFLSVARPPELAHAS
jgi:hypothetical protein